MMAIEIIGHHGKERWAKPAKDEEERPKMAGKRKARREETCHKGRLGETAGGRSATKRNDK